MSLNNDRLCCPEFNPSRFEDKIHIWNNKPFLKDEVKQIFHIPLNMGQVVNRMFEKIKKANAVPKDNDFLMLCYDPSPWKSEIYMTTTKKVANGKNVTLSGKFLSNVYDGPYNAVPFWIKDFEEKIKLKDEKVKKYYIHYAYCPKCSQKYGHNYAIVFGELVTK